MKKNKKLILIFLALLWVFYIFFNSNQDYNASNLRSYNIISKFNIGNYQIQYIANKVLRKIAHVIEYMVFTLIILNILKSLKIKNGYRILISLFLCISIGLTDEYYQSFIPGRSSRISDVFIDFLGGILAIVFYNIGRHILKRHRKKEIDKKL